MAKETSRMRRMACRSRRRSRRRTWKRNRGKEEEGNGPDGNGKEKEAVKKQHEHMCLPIKRADDDSEAGGVKEDGLSQEEGREDVPEEGGQGEGGRTVRRRLLK